MDSSLITRAICKEPVIQGILTVAAGRGPHSPAIIPQLIYYFTHSARRGQSHSRGPGRSRLVDHRRCRPHCTYRFWDHIPVGGHPLGERGVEDREFECLLAGTYTHQQLSASYLSGWYHHNSQSHLFQQYMADIYSFFTILDEACNDLF